MAGSTPSLTVLQINLNHCRNAQLLLEQTAYEQGADVVLVSDPLWAGRDWAVDRDGLSALWATNPVFGRTLKMVYSGGGAVVVEAGGFTLCSCYYPPRLSLEEFEERMEEVGGVIRSARLPVVVAGDFNAKSPLWGSKETNTRDEVLEQWAESCGLIPLCASGGPTFDTNGRTSVIDFAMVSPALGRRWSGSEVLRGVYSASDHLYVRHNIGPHGRAGKMNGEREMGRHDDGLLVAGLSGWKVGPLPSGSDGGAATEWMNAAIDGLQSVLDEAWVPLPRNLKKRKPCRWWNREVAEARRAANVRRRALTTARSKSRDPETISQLDGLYKKARKELHITIIRAKESCW